MTLATDLGPREHPFPARYARRFTTMLIETSIYMRALLQEFLIAGGRLVVREIPRLEAEKRIVEGHRRFFDAMG